MVEDQGEAGHLKVSVDAFISCCGGGGVKGCVFFKDGGRLIRLQ